MKSVFQENVIKQHSSSKTLRTKNGLCRLWRSFCRRL